jgi:hypothetical protein
MPQFHPHRLDVASKNCNPLPATATMDEI